MGAARKRRLALIKDGRPEVAKTQYYPPSRLIEQKFLSDPDLDKAMTEAFETTRRDQVPTRETFHRLLVVAGLKSFWAHAERQKAEQNGDPLIAMPTAEQVVKLG